MGLLKVKIFIFLMLENFNDSPRQIETVSRSFKIWGLKFEYENNFLELCLVI